MVVKLVGFLSKNSETRTFRLDFDVLKELEQEARKQGATVNGLVCRILRNYVRVESRANQIGIISFFRNDFIELLSMLDEGKISELGAKLGTSTTKEAILLLFGGLSINTFREFLILFLCGYLKWTSLYEIENKDYLEIRVRHDMGIKWSLFIKNYIESALISALQIKPEFKCVSNSTLIFRINKT
ncbi:MAG: hypothetical protein ACP5KV_04660 [Candidatus Methanomethylicaceae archaeon]